MRNNAFTLSEVLITLGIIGIIAALTIPGIITKYQKKAAATKLKIAYQTISEVIQRAKLDYGENLEIPEEISSTTTIYHNNIKLSKLYFDPYFKGAYRYNGSKIGIKDKSQKGYFIISYAGKDGKDKNPLCTAKGFCYWLINHGSNYYEIVIDINGPQKPNVAGRDVFLFRIDDKYIPGVGYTRIGKIRPINRDSNTGQNSCNNTTYQIWNGSTCADLIINNGWEIPDDYPW